MHYGNAISAERAKVKEAETKRVEAERKLYKAKAVAERLKKKMHETEC